MARMHVLTGGATGNLFTVVVHAPTPAGVNAAGVSWKVALGNSGLQSTSALPVGNGFGQIQTSELNSITGGDLIEAVMQWEDNPNWNNTERQADLNARATIAVNQVLADYQQRLKYFGFTVA